VVDDYDFRITHVVRAVEHLPNTPRQIFIAQSLGYALPIYAHLPYVAEPGGTAKLSKRKLDKYLKQKDFAMLSALGATITANARLQTTPETFNPVVVDFYRETGFLPGAILNYLLLLGWSLDDSTEDFTLEEAKQHFSLERVNKAPASFDPQKLLAFQARWMHRLDTKKKVAMVLPYLKKAGLLADPVACAMAEHCTKVVSAAADRIKVAGDILEFDEFFVADDQMRYDQAGFDKRVRGEPKAVELLEQTLSLVRACEPWSVEALEGQIKAMVEARGQKLGICINAIRLALTGKTSGVGVFDAFGILGKESSEARIARCIQVAKET
jgi:glutamyl-tRNA synthetase